MTKDTFSPGRQRLLTELQYLTPLDKKALALKKPENGPEASSHTTATPALYTKKLALVLTSS